MYLVVNVKTNAVEMVDWKSLNGARRKVRTELKRYSEEGRAEEVLRKVQEKRIPLAYAVEKLAGKERASYLIGGAR